MSQVRKRDIQGPTVESGSKVSTLWKKSMTVNSEWENKDDLLDVIYWLRQVFAIINGIAWGLLPVQGLFGIALFLAINCLIVYIYTSKYQKVDEDDFGGIQELLKEGLFTAFAVFVVSWVMVYTATYNQHQNL